MAALFRKLSNRRYWDNHDWIPPGDVQADALKDLITVDNSLSIYIVEGGQFDRLVAALATTKENLDRFDFAIAPETIIGHLKVKCEAVSGATLDEEANAWHRDLKEISATQLAHLARLIKAQGQVKRLPEAKVRAIVQNSIAAGYIDKTRLNERISASLRKKGII